MGLCKAETTPQHRARGDVNEVVDEAFGGVREILDWDCASLVKTNDFEHLRTRSILGIRYVDCTAILRKLQSGFCTEFMRFQLLHS